MATTEAQKLVISDQIDPKPCVHDHAVDIDVMCEIIAAQPDVKTFLNSTLSHGECVCE